MRHENLVCLLGVCKEADADFYMVMELLSGGALNDYLRGREGRKLNTEQLTEIGIEVKQIIYQYRRFIIKEFINLISYDSF